VNILKEPHALLGILVLLLVMPQVFLGYVMRKNSTTSRELGRMKNIHLWLGRVILFGGCINTIV
jgi:TRAP-type C4-dicarboxylate transport system permease small subunit